MPLCSGLAIVALTRRRAQPVKAGAGSYFSGPKGSDKGLPAAPLRTEAMLKKAAPTSQWYSTLIFDPKPGADLRAAHDGPCHGGRLRNGVAGQGGHGHRAARHRDRLSAPRPVGDLAGRRSSPARRKLAKTGDWSIDISFARGADDMRVTVAHGNPYAFLQVSRGDLRLRLPAAGERIDTGADARVLALRVKGKAYALFAPTGARWESASPTRVGRAPACRQALHVCCGAARRQAETLALFTRHAYAFVEDTRVDWRYEAAASQIETTFKASDAH